MQVHSRKVTRNLGSTFNLKILWSTGATTWEPLDVIFADAVEYARRKNLLGNPHWSKVRDHAVKPTPTTFANIDDATELEDDASTVNP